LINAATPLDYAVRGFAVFPCLEKSKAPACGQGFRDGTSNPATIRRWWNGCHNYNIGIATGLISAVWVLDVDGATGAESLESLEASNGPLPPTLCSITSAGCHLWFRTDGQIPSSAGRVGAGLDVRGDGGYVLAPPSIHPDGPRYRWAGISGQLAQKPAPAPDWLVRLTKQRPGAPKIIVPELSRRREISSGAYGRAALDRECDALANAARGGRNHALNRASFALHQLVAGGELDGAEVHHRLVQAAIANGLMTDPTDGPRSVEKTIASGARAGLQHPRSRSAR
jgi:hypothetical protein